MFQVTFSEQAMKELNTLDIMDQMEIIERLGGVVPQDEKGTVSDIGRVHREGKDFYRLKTKDHRVYFEFLPDGIIHAHYILHQHTIADFVFRFKLPYAEETMFEQQDSFWKYLDSLKK